jgi:hypothetical protein
LRKAEAEAAASTVAVEDVAGAAASMVAVGAVSTAAGVVLAVFMEVSADVADLGVGAVSVVGMVSTDEGMDGVGADTDTVTDMAVHGDGRTVTRLAAFM